MRGEIAINAIASRTAPATMMSASLGNLPDR